MPITLSDHILIIASFLRSKIVERLSMFLLFGCTSNSRVIYGDLTFSGWKRLILAEFPRQFLNALIVSDLYSQSSKKPENGKKLFQTISSAFESQTQEGRVYLSLQCITITIWIISALGLLIAFFVYIPLLCTIRGNLKEYCVHKVDKRYVCFNLQ